MRRASWPEPSSTGVGMTETSAPRTARDFARIELTRAILASARRQLAEVGPAALSVRAVARDLGIDPALYLARVIHADLTVAEAALATRTP